jgi:diaminohydroxyphosphoribosylaminopyrimidine deaminase / 5-amino-6-(5-phosphoribosylamino)uracil reductase
MRDAGDVRGATLYVTLEPCCTYGRTPPCTAAIITARIKKVVIAATDPNPAHHGKGVRILKRAGIEVESGICADAATELNAAFNHWIVHRTPLVTVKAAMTLDGKIATRMADSKWITNEKSRVYAMRLRQSADAILVGINTVLRDDPSLSVRAVSGLRTLKKNLRRIILDSEARTPLSSKVVRDEFAALTTIVVTERAPKDRVKALGNHINIWVAPDVRRGMVRAIDLRWLLQKLGSENVTSLLVEGGGEVNAAFLLTGVAHRIAFFYAPKVIGGCAATRTVEGKGFNVWDHVLRLEDRRWQRFGDDLLLQASISPQRGKS